jgi:hypothetical protein
LQVDDADSDIVVSLFVPMPANIGNNALIYFKTKKNGGYDENINVSVRVGLSSSDIDNFELTDGWKWYSLVQGLAGARTSLSMIFDKDADCIKDSSICLGEISFFGVKKFSDSFNISTSSILYNQQALCVNIENQNLHIEHYDSLDLRAKESFFDLSSIE